MRRYIDARPECHLGQRDPSHNMQVDEGCAGGPAPSQGPSSLVEIHRLIERFVAHSLKASQIPFCIGFPGCDETPGDPMLMRQCELPFEVK
jgi:hypothetical protein